MSAIKTGGDWCSDRDRAMPWRLLARGRAGRKHYEDDGARAWFDDSGRSTRDSEDGSRLWVTMGAWRMRKMAASHAWSEGASEDEGSHVMAAMAMPSV